MEENETEAEAIKRIDAENADRIQRIVRFRTEHPRTSRLLFVNLLDRDWYEKFDAEMANAKP